MGRAAKTAKGATAGVPVEGRIDAVGSIRLATKLEEEEDPTGGMGGPNWAWTPSEFGEARMAALGWLETLARRETEAGRTRTSHAGSLR